MALKAFSLIAAFGFIATTLAVVPTAAADAPAICPSPLTLGVLIQCAADKAVALIENTEATVICLMSVPPTSYPGGLGSCVVDVTLATPALP